MNALKEVIGTCGIAVARGCDVDKPRNLVKSVTVE
jgi:glucosamine 6-phosphate synthetase-like amidotransferase/phosphosugar isomerase protein